jgi:hypothetical protein
LGEKDVFTFMRTFAAHPLSDAHLASHCVGWRRVFHRLAYFLNLTNTASDPDKADKAPLLAFAKLLHRIDNSFLYAYYVLRLWRKEVITSAIILTDVPPVSLARPRGPYCIGVPRYLDPVLVDTFSGALQRVFKRNSSLPGYLALSLPYVLSSLEEYQPCQIEAYKVFVMNRYRERLIRDTLATPQPDREASLFCVIDPLFADPRSLTFENEKQWEAESLDGDIWTKARSSTSLDAAMELANDMDRVFYTDVAREVYRRMASEKGTAFVFPDEYNPDKVWEQFVHALNTARFSWGLADLSGVTKLDLATLVWAFVSYKSLDGYDNLQAFHDQYLAAFSIEGLVPAEDPTNPAGAWQGSESYLLLSSVWYSVGYCALFTVARMVTRRDWGETREDFRKAFVEEAFGLPGREPEPNPVEEVGVDVFLSRFWLGEFCACFKGQRALRVMLTTPEAAWFMWRTALLSPILWEDEKCGIPMLLLTALSGKLDAVLATLIAYVEGKQNDSSIRLTPDQKKRLAPFVAIAFGSGEIEDHLLILLKDGNKKH